VECHLFTPIRGQPGLRASGESSGGSLSMDRGVCRRLDEERQHRIAEETSAPSITPGS
jgi:hypothetical protein